MARYTVDLSEDIESLMTGLAKEKRTTKAEILRRALASYGFLIRSTDPDKGTKVSITDENDRVLKDVVLP